MSEQLDLFEEEEEQEPKPVGRTLLKRMALADELIAWLKARGEIKGRYSWYVVHPFCIEKHYADADVWKAWEYMRENGLLNKDLKDGWALQGEHGH